MKRKVSFFLFAVLLLQLFSFTGIKVIAEDTTTTTTTTTTVEPNTIKILTVFPEQSYNKVPISTPIYLELDREIFEGPGMSKVSLKDKSGQVHNLDYAIEGNEIVFFSTSNPLKYTTEYNINIPKDAVIDAEGNSLEKDYVVDFTTDKEYTVLSGVNRYETCLRISQEGWAEGSDYAVLATGANFPDALSAAPLAAKYGAPILLVKPGELEAALEAEITRLAVKTIFIAGGTGAVSQKVEDTLKAKGIAVTRLSGKDRYETSVAIAKQLDVNQNTTVFLATGANFPDALSVAPIAAAKQMPIILTDKTTLPEVTKKFFADTKISKFYIVGGTGVVNLAPGQLTTTWMKRIGGNNRYETNLNVMAEFASEISFTYTFFATGRNFPDALAGSALAGLAMAPIILVEPSMPQNVINEFRNIKEFMSHKYLLGGEGVVPKSIVDRITK